MTTAGTRRAAPAFPAPPIPEDLALPGAANLLRPEGLAVIESFLATSGWRLQAGRAVQVLYRPGRSLVVRYRAEAEDTAGATRMVWLCAETRDRATPVAPAPAGPDRASMPAEPVTSVGPHLVWCFPYDPTLPGLAEASRGLAVHRLVNGLGRPSVGVSVEPVCYRPHRRATFRYTVLGGRGHDNHVLYGKVLRRDRADDFLRMAGELEEGPRRRRAPWGPRPSPELDLSLPTAETQSGLLLFEPMTGHSLRDLLLRGGSLPRPERLPRLLEDLPRVPGMERAVGPVGGNSRRDPRRMLHQTRKLLVQITPHLAGRVDRLADTLRQRMSEDPFPARVIHGDLYDANIFVGPEYRLGLIDLDDLGWGDPATDVANFSAHLLALALAVPSASPLIRAYRRLARPAFMGHLGIGDASMAWREALVMLLLAPGPFRVLEPRWPAEVARRVEVAERLLAGGL